MEELHGWWEVPTIAHFCYTFKGAFNLFHFEIEELEAALIPSDDENIAIQPCASVEQLIMRLLQGCCPSTKVTVSAENWEEMLQTYLKENSNGTKLAIPSQPFNDWDLRQKVEVLLTLCELRLDAEDVIDRTKNMESNSLRVESIGVDGGENMYWYFFGMRLYKENPQKHAEYIERRNNALKAAAKFKKKEETEKKKQMNESLKPPVQNGIRKSLRKRQRSPEPASPAPTLSPPEVPKPAGWELICETIDDWESFAKSLSHSRNAKDKSLFSKITETYLPLITEAVAKRELLLKKKLLETAPRRISARIDKVKKEREKECEIAERVRQRRLEERRRLEELALKQKEEEEKHMRSKRLAERHKAIEDRAKRARLREQKAYGMDDGEISEEDDEEEAASSNEENDGKENSSEDEEDSDESSDNSGPENKVLPQPSQSQTHQIHNSPQLNTRIVMPLLRSPNANNSLFVQNKVQSRPPSTFVTLQNVNTSVFQPGCVIRLQQGLARIQNIGSFQRVGTFRFNTNRRDGNFGITYSKMIPVVAPPPRIIKPPDVAAFGSLRDNLNVKLNNLLPRVEQVTQVQPVQQT